MLWLTPSKSLITLSSHAWTCLKRLTKKSWASKRRLATCSRKLGTTSKRSFRCGKTSKASVSRTAPKFCKALKRHFKRTSPWSKRSKQSSRSSRRLHNSSRSTKQLCNSFCRSLNPTTRKLLQWILTWLDRLKTVSSNKMNTLSLKSKHLTKCARIWIWRGYNSRWTTNVRTIQLRFRSMREGFHFYRIRSLSCRENYSRSVLCRAMRSEGCRQSFRQWPGLYRASNVSIRSNIISIASLRVRMMSKEHWTGSKRLKTSSNSWEKLNVPARNLSSTWRISIHPCR